MSRPRIVIVGAGFAGYRTAQTLSRMSRGKADITLLNPTDYFLYLPLLPQVAAGVLEPRRVTVSLPGTLPRVRLVLGEADRVDMDARTVHYTGPEGHDGTLTYDRLVLAVGSVNKLLPVPGVAEHAHGFRGLPEALYLRDHVTRQLELAAADEDHDSRAARRTFVVVGAGYTGTEVAAHGRMYTDAQVRRHPPRQGMRPRWMLLDIAPRVLPEMDERLSRTADRVLRRRGVDVRMGTSVKEATHDGVLLTDGEFVPTRTLVWCVGVRPDPLVESTGQPLERGRLVVDPFLQVPGRPEVFACGDAAAVPDANNPGGFTPMTAQHAWRQGRTAAVNVAASLGVGARRPYRHRDLGFVVDLGGAQAAADPLGVPLSGPAAGAVTRGYHLAAMPGNRVRVAADWLLNSVLPRQAVQLGLVRSWSVPLDSASPELARVPGGPARRPEPEPAGGSERTGRSGGHAGPDGPAGPAERTEPGEPGDTPIAEIIDNTEKAQLAGAEPAPRPGREPARNQPGGEPAKSRPGPEPDKGQPGGEPAKPRPGPGPGTRARSGAKSGRGRPGSDAQRDRPGGGSGRNRSGGRHAKAGPEPARGGPPGPPARNLPGDTAEDPPGPDPAEGWPHAPHAGPAEGRSRPGPSGDRAAPGATPAEGRPRPAPPGNQPRPGPAGGRIGRGPVQNASGRGPEEGRPGREAAAPRPGPAGEGRTGQGPTAPHPGPEPGPAGERRAGREAAEPHPAPGPVRRDDIPAEGDS